MMQIMIVACWWLQEKVKLELKCICDFLVLPAEATGIAPVGTFDANILIRLFMSITKIIFDPFHLPPGAILLMTGNFTSTLTWEYMVGMLLN